MKTEPDSGLARRSALVPHIAHELGLFGTTLITP
jgi:hypothetical protein